MAPANRIFHVSKFTFTMQHKVRENINEYYVKIKI